MAPPPEQAASPADPFPGALTLPWSSHGARIGYSQTALALAISLHPLKRRRTSLLIELPYQLCSGLLDCHETVAQARRKHPRRSSRAGTRGRTPRRARRPTVPIRKTFVQAPPGQTPRHGPLKAFVSAGDLRGLRAYLVVAAANSAENSDGWRTTLDFGHIDTCFDADLSATSPAARTAAWRTLGRLEPRPRLPLPGTRRPEDLPDPAARGRLRRALHRRTGEKHPRPVCACRDGSGRTATTPESTCPAWPCC